MKRMCFLLGFLGVLVSQVWSHAPSKVTMAPSGEAGKWKVTAEHSVADSTSHYIELITVMVDGKELKKLELKKQSLKAREVQEVVLPQIRKGSKVEVRAKCNKLGAKTYSFTAE